MQDDVTKPVKDEAGMDLLEGFVAMQMPEFDCLLVWIYMNFGLEPHSTQDKLSIQF